MKKSHPDAGRPANPAASRGCAADPDVEVEYAVLSLSGGLTAPRGDLGTTTPGAAQADLWEWGVCYVRPAADTAQDEGRQQLLEAFQNYVGQGGFIDAADLRNQESEQRQTEAHAALDRPANSPTDGKTEPSSAAETPVPLEGNDLGSVLFGARIALNLALDSVEEARGEILVALEDVEAAFRGRALPGTSTSATSG